MQHHNPIGFSDQTKIGNMTWSSLKHQALLSDWTVIQGKIWANLKKDAMAKDYEKSQKFVSFTGNLDHFLNSVEVQ